MRALLEFATALAVLWVPIALAEEIPDYHGRWQGPFLMAAGAAAGSGSRPSQVHQGVIDIATDGSVRGSVSDAGCTLAGSSSAYVSSANAALELTLAGCNDARFNGRYSGKLIGNPLLGYASLRLSGASGSGGVADSAGPQLSAIVRH
ncbi:hypothetical protein BH11PSE13_BH11PSE13_13230 [soil metagenome]